MTVVRVCQMPKVMALKKGVIMKFTTFVDEHLDKFKREKDPMNPVNAPEILELVMDESAANQLLYDTQELHDGYVIEYPELMVDLPPAPGPGPSAREKPPKGKGKGKKGSYGGFGGGGGGFGGGMGGGFMSDTNNIPVGGGMGMGMGSMF